jgi:hypothetical protein
MTRLGAGLLVAGCLLAAGSRIARAQTEPIDRDVVESGEERAGPDVDVELDGTVNVDWQFRPNLGVRLQVGASPDGLLQDWPVSMIEGTQTTSAQVVIERRIGAVTLHASGGVGIATTTLAAGPEGGAISEQSPAAVGSLYVELALPRSWYIRAGANASASASGAAVFVGLSAGTEF